MAGIDDILDTTAIEWLILADAADVVGGKVYVMGGGWDRLVMHSGEMRKTLAVALAIRVPWHETNRAHPFEICMTHEDGGEIVTVTGEAEVRKSRDVPPGQPQLVMMVINFDTVFEREGTYLITAIVNGGGERSVRFRLVHAPVST